MLIETVLTHHLDRGVILEEFAPFHQHFLAMALIRRTPKTEKEIKDWLSKLVHAVGMEVWWGPVVKDCRDPGNEGPSGIILLKTSHASIHFWDQKEVPYCQMDLYSCKKFDPQIVLDLLNTWEPIKVRHLLINRNAGIPQR